ncbi:MATE family efflux transporter [Stackebrandtia nassauensis]|uniref:MATE efflux family protein n=1 Tax=Stackebrandtia nassauensis (strain DSM 44728 / CIP 108903 / NRRL B-16338 / NBRC 102104 / LLR-40K-21) TaxID=446470 RepID=D3PVA5_STANL|nr:MATE family efflux transporter [Stackebrandtia nassauensis]ADD41158.1 MATE efflux family protein [Stackebrandtia nassauensis DSM 44728]
MTIAADAPAANPASLRRITALALPALVVLAAEPLYILVDTAVVGHLGRVPLAALALGGGVMSVAAWIGNVLAYGTTGRVARRFGAGQRAEAVAEGVQGSWLAVIGGLLMIAVVEIFAGPLSRALAGGPGAVATAAEQWLRIGVLGAPFLLLAMAGQGWMRGVQDTRRPMYIVLAASVGSAILAPILVYPAGMGLVGSAVANVAAQLVSGSLFIRALVSEGVSLRPQWSVIRRQLGLSRDLIIRGGTFQLCFISAAAVAARFGAASLAAHQIGLQLWFFAALALDAVAIAAQALIGAELGGGSAQRARDTARRIGWIGLGYGTAFAVAVLAGAPFLPGLFSSDATVHEQAAVLWPWFIGLLPIAGLVFALDGVFIGAGDTAFMRNMTIVAALFGFLPLIWLTYGFGWGLGGIWAGLSAFMLLRLVALLLRQRGGKWAVVGAER